MENKELIETLKQIKDEENQSLDEKTYEEKRTNADCLNDLANINMTLSIIGAILIWINFAKNEITGDINWVGITCGIISIISGCTLFFMLKTIVDIYKKVNQ